VRSLVEPVHNERSALDAGTPPCFHIEARWPGASESERWAQNRE
jgi:hypothetical protein